MVEIPKVEKKIMWAIVICLVAVPVSILFLAMVISSIHFIEEGHVGIYYKYGALQVVENSTLKIL